MNATRFTYQRLVELVDGDQELISHLIDEGLIERRDDDRALVDVDHVLIARTLWRELEIDWAGVGVILHLHDQLKKAQSRIAELERELANATHS